MLRLLARPTPLVLLLALASAIPVAVALVRLVQIPLGAWPGEAARLAVAPLAWWGHAAAGVGFALLGPVQFARALRRRFGAVHRLAGRGFVLAGLAMGLSGHALLWQVAPQSTPLLDVARGVFGTALVAALLLGLSAARARDLPRHRAWMIRAYALGMGSGTVGLAFLPLHLVTGQPVTGLTSDLVFVGWWAAMVALAEAVIRHINRKGTAR